ncbi:MAG TPA: hypothetical protein VHB02_09155 [Acidimicrobiales bacterium]|nr:hypothetical protein [Acidimicrobiales bacterium]
MASTAPVPVPVTSTTFPTFLSTDCTAAGSCTAVGQYVPPDSRHQEGMVDTEVGGHWTTTAVPADRTGRGTVFLVAVSCTTTGWCAAGGWTGTGGLLVTGSGTTWSAVAAPLPATPPTTTAAGTEIEGVSCPASGSCWAVGSYQTAHGTEGLVETLSDGAWTPLPVTVPVGTGTRLAFSAVTCPVAGWCSAAGEYFPNGTAASQAAVATLSGGRWSAQPATLPAGALQSVPSELNQVSCPAVGVCVAVGQYDVTSSTVDPTAGNYGLIEPLSLGGWSGLRAPVPAGWTGRTVELPSVSCASTTFCVVGGNDTLSGGFFDAFDGQGWSAAPADSTDDTLTFVSAVACPAAGWCQAVGNSDIRALGWTLGGTGWAVADLPVPAGGNPTSEATTFQAAYHPLSCTAVGSCLAAGRYADDARVSQGLFESMTPPAPTPPAPPGQGYRMVGADGGVFAFGDAAFSGAPATRPVTPVVAAAADGATGYWEATAGGVVLPFGPAGNFGSMGGQALAAPVVGMAATADGGGYWLDGADGGVFAFGDAPFAGSMGGRALDAAVVGLVATADGGGYWEVAADGGIFAFGDAGFFGSMAGRALSAPVVAATA